MTKSIVLFTLLTPSIAFASVVNLECALSSEQSRHNMVLFVDLDKTKQEATITKESGAPYKAKALLSTDYIQLKKVRIGPPGILDVEKYTVDRNTLAITVTPNMPTQFPARQLETAIPEFSGSCALRKPNPNRKI